MLSLSNQYTAATTETQRTVIQAAGQGMLATYLGTAFDVYYVFGAVALFIISIVMLKSRVFSKATAYIGLLMAFLMIIPTSAGKLGLIMASVSLIPTIPWMILVARRLLRLGRPDAQALP